MSALAGWRVLEVADGKAAAFCAKILSDLGADVVKVEPPEGHLSRAAGPRRPQAADQPSAGFLYLNTGKASVVVDETDAGNTRLRQLVAEADVVITDLAGEALGRLGEVPAGVICASIRLFGSTGPYASHRAHHLTTFHAGGEGAILPSGPNFGLFPDRPPIQLGGDIADFDAGWNAAVAVLAACYDRCRGEKAQRIDVSVQESQLTLNRTRLSRFNNDGVVLGREGNRYGITGMMRCRDGWVQLVSVREEHWDQLLASPDAGDLADGRFASAELRREHAPAFGVAIADWCAARSKVDVVRVMAPIGPAVGIYATPPDLLASEQLAHREFFQAVDDGNGGAIRMPGAPYRLSRTPATVQPAPKLGSSSGFRSDRTDRPKLQPGRLLEGIRVLDFTWAAAGPYAGLLLGLLGADVLKVETSRRPDPARRGFLADYGGINRSPNFNELNLNKRGLQVDLTRPEGLDLVRRLVSQVDVVIDNFRPGVMAKFGLDPTTLLAAHPGLVVGSSSANGSSGPEAMAAGLASIFGATGGLSEQTGYPDGPPTEVGESTDYRSANAFAVGLVAALLHRAATGEGQHVDVASREVVTASGPDALFAHQLGIPWQPRLGNGHREMAPHGVFPCAGDDSWVAIAVGDADEWSNLCTVLGRDDWADTYASAADRRAAVDIIDEAITEWTCQRPPYDAFHELQAAGVPASPVMTNEMLAADPHLVARGIFVEVEHPEIGVALVMRAPWLFSDATCEIRRHGPLMGQDNEYVLSELLGLSPEERAELEEVMV